MNPFLHPKLNISQQNVKIIDKYWSTYKKDRHKTIFTVLAFIAISY